MSMTDQKSISLNGVRTLAPGQTIWDSKVRGFGARRQKGSGVSYILVYRTKEGRQRWHTIGRHGSPWTPDLARKEALRILWEVVAGGDPAAERSAMRKAATVADLCDQYLQDAGSGRLLMRRGTSKKASTLLTDKSRIVTHIKPILGALKVSAVRREDVERFMHAVAEGQKTARKHVGRGGASRTIGLLGAIFTYAVRKRLRSDNPAHGIVRFADGRRDRRLADDEYKALGAALRAGVASIWPPAIAATRFLALTGWRSGEALGLRWAEVDLPRRTATLPDTKTGRSVRPLSRAACDVLRNVPRTGDNVFAATRGDGRMAGLPKFWAKIAKLGGLPVEVTPHTLRHSFASLAGDLGYSEPTIAALVGHQGRTVTSRYVHSADAVLLTAADAVAARIAELMGERRQDASIVPLRAGGGNP
jgi:integrase